MIRSIKIEFNKPKKCSGCGGGMHRKHTDHIRTSSGFYYDISDSYFSKSSFAPIEQINYCSIILYIDQIETIQVDYYPPDNKPTDKLSEQELIVHFWNIVSLEEKMPEMFKLIYQRGIEKGRENLKSEFQLLMGVRSNDY